MPLPIRRIGRNFAVATYPQGGDMESTIREARLRPQYASLYPALEPGTWQPASAIGRQLLLWHLTAPALPDGERLMSEEHFEFRGGTRRDTAEAGARTRTADLRQA